jgi:MFS family permease
MNGTRAPAVLAVLGSLWFSQGLPFGFFTQALPLLLRDRGLSLGAIGLSSLLAAPWALKFAWAPAVDRLGWPGFGRRRSWIVPMQIVSATILAALAAVPAAASSTAVLMGAVLLVNLASATQDVATDGLAVDTLAPAHRGLGNGLQVAAYRVGMIVGGGALLILHDRLGHTVTFLSMSGLTLLASVPVLLVREAACRIDQPGDRSERAAPAMVHFIARPGAARLLLLVVSYKAGDAFANSMLRPFLADAGLGLADVGWLLGTVGFVAGLLGAVCGGALVGRLGRKNALVGFGLLQAATVAGYAAVAAGTPSYAALYAVCGAEHFAGGMATAALFTCMMDWCSPRASATDYTVQASAVVVATGAASAVAGFSAELLGYRAHFALAALLAFASVALVRWCFPGAQIVRAIRGPGAEVPSCT